MTKEQIELERWEIAKIIADNAPQGCECDDSDFEWAAHSVQVAGFRKQSEGEWFEDYDSGEYILSCSLCCEHYWIEDEHEKKPNFCPNCGARMKGE